MDLIAKFKEGIEEGRAAAAARNKLLSHWTKLHERLNYSPREFYSLVARNLEERAVPGLEAAPIMLRQGGILSARRLYLQFRRERFVFEICAAQFGTGFFVSSRLFDRRRDARWYHYLFLVMLLSFIGFASWLKIGWIGTSILLSGLLTLLWSLMRLSLLDTMLYLGDKLPDVPILGPIYETLFRPDTYYRQDTNKCYQEAVHNSVMQAVAEMTEQKGQKGAALAPEPSIEDLRRR